MKLLTVALLLVCIGTSTAQYRLQAESLTSTDLSKFREVWRYNNEDHDREAARRFIERNRSDFGMIEAEILVFLVDSTSDDKFALVRPKGQTAKFWVHKIQIILPGGASLLQRQLLIEAWRKHYK